MHQNAHVSEVTWLARARGSGYADEGLFPWLVQTNVGQSALVAMMHVITKSEGSFGADP